MYPLRLGATNLHLTDFSEVGLICGKNKLFGKG